MIKFDCEQLYNARDEIALLAEQHHNELNIFGKKHIDPNYDAYLVLEMSNLLKIFTVRDGEELKGYKIYILAPSLHYKEVVIAASDIMFLEKKYRKGLVGYKFVKFCIEELKKDSRINAIQESWMKELDLTSIYKRLGFTDTNISSTLYLGGEKYGT